MTNLLVESVIYWLINRTIKVCTCSTVKEIWVFLLLDVQYLRWPLGEIATLPYCHAGIQFLQYIHASELWPTFSLRCRHASSAVTSVL